MNLRELSSKARDYEYIKNKNKELQVYKDRAIDFENLKKEFELKKKELLESDEIIGKLTNDVNELTSENSVLKNQAHHLIEVKIELVKEIEQLKGKDQKSMSGSKSTKTLTNIAKDSLKNLILITKSSANTDNINNTSDIKGRQSNNMVVEPNQDLVVIINLLNLLNIIIINNLKYPNIT